MKRLVVPVLAMTALLGPGLSVVGCSSGSTTVASAQEMPATPGSALTSPLRVGVADFAEVITAPGVQIIDVRTPEEFAGGHIAGAVNIPVQQSDFVEQVSRLDANGTYAVYCRSGNRSRPAVDAMRRAGIDSIYELASGTKGWAAEGQPLTR
jgi:phage shock protein E